jgi:NF-kappa-B inhibitor-like protein 1
LIVRARSLRVLTWHAPAQAAEAESARILREEVARDAAWRRNVQGAGLTQQRVRVRALSMLRLCVRSRSSLCIRAWQAAYMAAWAALESSAGTALLRERDFPWPTHAGREADAGPMLLAGVAGGARKQALREELMRWHPDKFGARYGARLAPAERERIHARVNVMSQTVATLFQDAKA